MAIFSKDDPRSLDYINSNDIIENILNSLGYKPDFSKCGNVDKSYILYNSYKVNSWDRSIAGFISKKYRGFDLLEHRYKDWKKDRNFKYDNKNYYYIPYIEIGNYYIYLNDCCKIIDYAKGLLSEEESEANEESIATKIKNLVMDEYLKMF